MDSHLLGHEFNEPTQRHDCNSNYSSALEEHRLALMLWDVSRQHASCDAQEKEERRNVAMLVTELDDEKYDSRWFKVCNLPDSIICL